MLALSLIKRFLVFCHLIGLNSASHTVQFLGLAFAPAVLQAMLQNFVTPTRFAGKSPPQCSHLLALRTAAVADLFNTAHALEQNLRFPPELMNERSLIWLPQNCQPGIITEAMAVIP